jgi:hypothetical protein
MSRNTKIILGILAGLVVVCICAVGGLFAAGLFAAHKAVDLASKNITSNPGEIEAIARRIVAFELPQGYHPEYGMSIMGYSLVGFSSSDGHSHIMMMQFPASSNLTPEEMEAQMHQATQGQSYTFGRQEMQVVEQRDITVRGEAATATIAEGTGNGETFRQLSVVFDGDDGPVLLVYSARVNEWDQAAIENLLASIQ